MASRFNIQKLLKRLLAPLADKERDILVARRGLDGRSERLTLAALGEKYGVTRERVRQIEVSATKEVAELLRKNEEARRIISAVTKHLQAMGGIERADRFLSEQAVLLGGENEKIFAPALTFILNAHDSPLLRDEDGEYYALWYTDKNALEDAQDFIKKLEAAFRERKSEIIDGNKFAALFARIAQLHGVNEAVGLNYISISKKFGLNPYGDIGLAEWPEIVPRTVRDRAYLVLKKIRRPLHFLAIAEEINRLHFDDKKAHAQTVHNELIKDDRFILVGRGTYGLAEHGYVSGTAREVIHRILKQKGPLRANDVLLAVQQERFFKPNTILLNLQNKKFFERLSDGRYRIRET